MWTSISELFSRIVNFGIPDSSYEDSCVNAFKQNGTPHTDMKLLEKIQYHEAGHAVVGSLCADRKLTAVTVLCYDDFRGTAYWEIVQGFATLSREQQMAVIAYNVAGEEAEKIKYGQGHISGGFGHGRSNNEDHATKDDREYAEERAQDFVTRWPHHNIASDINPKMVLNEARLLAREILLKKWDAVEKIVALTKTEPVLAGSVVLKIINNNKNILSPSESTQPVL